MPRRIEQTSGRQPSHSPQGYRGIKGNEAADILAKLASWQNPTSLESVIGVSNRLVTEDINKWLAEKHQEEWHKAAACKQAKTLMGEHLNPKRAAGIRRLSRNKVKTITEVFIGHGNLTYHRHKIGLAESPLCRLCGEDNETFTHILCDCPAIKNKRQSLTGYAYIDVAVIQTKNVVQVLALWHGLWGHA